MAGYNINLLLHTSRVAGFKSYEEIAENAFGIKGKVVTSVMIVLHCLGGKLFFSFLNCFFHWSHRNCDVMPINCVFIMHV